MVINPSCEQLLLAPDGAGGWRNASLDDFTAAGFVPGTGDQPPRIRALRAERTTPGSRSR